MKVVALALTLLLALGESCLSSILCRRHITFLRPLPFNALPVYHRFLFFTSVWLLNPFTSCSTDHLSLHLPETLHLIASCYHKSDLLLLVWANA